MAPSHDSPATAATAGTPDSPATAATPGTSTAPAAATAASGRPRRRARRLAGFALGAGLLLGGAATGLWWLADQPAALAALLNRVPGLTVQGLSGSLRQPTLTIAQLQWRAPRGGMLVVDDLRLAGWSWRWQPHPGALLALQVDALGARALQWRSGPPTGQTPAPPADLRLPIDLAVGLLTVDRVQVDELPVLGALRARVRLGDEQGGLHRIDGLQARLAVGEPERPAAVLLQGRAQIASRAPFQLQAELKAEGRWQQRGAASSQNEASAPARTARSTPATRASPAAAGLVSPVAEHWQARLTADGPLAALALAGTLSGPDRGEATPRLDASARVQPFAAWPLGTLQLRTRGLDLRALAPAWPHTALAGELDLDTRSRDQPVQARGQFTNALPGPWDAGRLPLRQLTLAARGTLQQPDRLGLDRFSLQLGDAAGPAGVVAGQGQWQGDRLALRLQLQDIQPARLHRSAAALRLDGPLSLEWRAAAAGRPPQLAAEGRLTGQPLAAAGPPVLLDAAATWQPGELQLRRATAQAGAASARLAGRVQWHAGQWQLASTGQLTDFDPRPWWPGTPGSAWQRGPHRLQGDWQVDLHGRRSPPSVGAGNQPVWLARLADLGGEARASLVDSRLAGVPLDAQLHWRRRGPGAGLQVQLDVAGNRLKAETDGTTADALTAAATWRVALQAPQLAALAPLAPLLAELAPATADWWPTGGALNAEAALRQAPGGWSSQGTLAAQQLRTAQATLGQAQARWQLGSRPGDALDLELTLNALVQGERRLDALTARVQGTGAAHRLQLQADSPLRLPAWTENLLGPAGTGSRLQWLSQGSWQAAAGGMVAGYRLEGGQLTLGARDTGGGNRAWLAAQDLSASVSRADSGAWRGLQVEPGRLQLAATTALRWQALRWEAGGAGAADRLTIDAELERFDVAPLLARLQPAMGWGGQLSLGGRIQVRSAERLDADITLERGGGDLTLTDDLGGVQALGISELRLALSAHDGLWQFAQGLVGSSFGSLAGAQLVTTPSDRRWPQPGDPLQGVLQARVANLGAWGMWVPPGWRLSGALDTQGVLGGTLGTPSLRGRMEGRQLGVRNMLQGVDLSDGELSVVLEGDTTRIERLRFKGGDGELRLTGGATLGAQPALQLMLEAERFRVLGRVDRRLVASGRSTVRLQRDALNVDGRLRIDEGLIDVSHSEAPTLDSDVVVRRQPGRDAPPADARATAPVPAAVRQARVALDIDLGEALRLRGRGVDTGVRGQLRLALPEGRPTLTGSVRTHQGRYAAYGQKLEISRGEFLFNGPVDNPRLDILALRPNLDVEVGVAITGPAAGLRVRLYSVPDMTDYERLSWLMLGRSSDGLGNADTALLQRAALALLSGDQGSAGDQLLETIGLTDFSVRQSGTDSNRETIISLGRQLSRRWYVGYERGVNTTLGTWQLVYRIAQRFTLRAQSGGENAIDLIWTWRW